MRWTSLILVQSQTLKVMKLTYKQKYLKFLIVTLSHEKHSIYQSGKLLNPWVLIKDSISISFLKRISASRAKIKRRVSWWIHTSLWRTSPFTKNPTIRSITIKRSYLQKSTKKLLAEMERKPYLIPNKKTTKHQPLIGRASWNQKACSEKAEKIFSQPTTWGTKKLEKVQGSETETSFSNHDGVAWYEWLDELCFRGALKCNVRSPQIWVIREKIWKVHPDIDADKESSEHEYVRVDNLQRGSI